MTHVSADISEISALQFVPLQVLIEAGKAWFFEDALHEAKENSLNFWAVKG